MIEQSQIINSCYQFINSQSNIVLIAKYSHIIPVVLSLVLGLFVFFKAKFNYFSKIFLIFVLVFSFWLIGDLITWSSSNYNLIYFVWSVLPYVEIIFYILGLYFAIISVQKTDISIYSKVILFLITLPPLYLTLIGKSVTGFSQPICEARNNNYLDVYKLFTEIALLIVLLFYIIRPYILKTHSKNRKSNLIVLGSMFLFLSVFGITEYISAITGIYEYNLYSLFLLPIFVLVIIYAVFELDIFNFDMLGTQYLVVGLVVLMVGQLFFANGSTDRLLTIITIITSVTLSIILFRNLKRESDQRLRIESLSEQLENYNQKLKNANEKLKILDKMKTEFVSLASHQLRSPLTAIKGYTSMLLEGDYGNMDPKAKETVERVMDSSNNLTLVVEDLLNVSKIEQGGMKYEMVRFDFGELVNQMAQEFSVTADKKGLKLNYNTDLSHKYFINGDKEKLRQIIVNLVDNAIKYTKQGSIDIKLDLNDEKILLSVKDTGIGISPEEKDILFKKFSRGDGSKVNSSGSGLGLYLVKELVEAHKGRVWVESEGVGKGSTFFVELDKVE